GYPSGASMTADERRYVERRDGARRIRRRLRRDDEQRLAGRHARWKPLRVLRIVLAIGDLHSRRGTGGVLDEDRVGRPVDLIADAVRFEGEPFAVGRPPASAGLEEGHETRAARRALVEWRRSGIPRARVGDPGVVDVLVVVVAPQIVLAGKCDQVRIDLIDARETGPHEVGRQLPA